MTLTDYLNAKMHDIWDQMPIIGQINYITFGIYIAENGRLDWNAHPTMNLHETDIYKTSRLCGNWALPGAVLAFRSLHRNDFEDTIENAQDLIDRLIDDNWSAIQTFDELVQTINHYKAMIDDLPRSQTNPLC